MLLHNLKIAWRNLLKYRLQSCISIFSLAVGMVCFSLSALWLHYEKSYDRHWPEAENIYVVRPHYAGESVYTETERETNDLTSYSMGLRLKAEFPEIDDICQAYNGAYLEMESDEIYGLEVDSLFCDFFGIKVLEGRSKVHLAEDEVAITPTLAQKLFPEGNAIGQTLRGKDYDGEHEYKIVAIVEDEKGRSHETFYMYLRGLDRERINTDNYLWLKTYIRVAPDKLQPLKEKLNKFSWRDLEDDQTLLVPLTELRSEGSNLIGIVRWEYLRLFVLLSAIVIGCGLFNYLSMLITHVRIRRRELLLRYVHGAHRSQLVMLVLTETGIILFFSALLAGGCILSLKERFSVMSRIQEQDLIVRWFLVFGLAIGILSLLLTALIVWLSSLRKLSQQLGRQSLHPHNSWGHRTNLFVQLSVSLCTLLCAITMQRQLHYLLYSTDMGLNRHNLGFFFNDDYMDENASKLNPAVKAEVEALPEIKVVFFGYDYPRAGHAMYLNQIDVYTDETIERLQGGYVNEAYASAIGMQLVEGELLNDNDYDKILLSESAVRKLGLTDPIGKTLTCEFFYVEKRTMTVKGIIKDMYSLSPLLPPDAIAFTLQPSLDSEWWKKATSYNRPFYVFQYEEGTDWNALCNKLEKIFQKHGFKGGINNMEQLYDACFVSEHALMLVLNIVTAISIMLSAFGIFSTLSLALQRRRKEIALRKVHGAKVMDIFRLFLSEYVWLLLGAAVVAFPIGYYLMHQWLSHYVRQVPFTWWLCPAILMGMAALILLTVFWQIWRAARENPADVMKSE